MGSIVKVTNGNTCKLSYVNRFSMTGWFGNIDNT